MNTRPAFMRLPIPLRSPRLALRLAIAWCAPACVLAPALALTLLTVASCKAQSVADAAASLQDARLAGALGIAPSSPVAGLGTSSASAVQASPLASRFAGVAISPCSGIDLHGFLQAFDPNELLTELRDSILGGAQAVVSNYLLALAYSAPTLVSILDMTDKTLGTRYSAFTKSCAMQHEPVGDAAVRVAQARAQCFSAQIASGAGPTDAMRRCLQPDRTGGSPGALPLPASLSTPDFLTRYTLTTLTPRVAALLDLLPDARIDQGVYQARAARITVPQLADLWTTGARKALDLIDDGAPVAAIPSCSVGPNASGPTGADPAGVATPPCLPASALGLVASPAYRTTRLLQPEARAIFKDALAGQLATVQLYADLIELGHEIVSLQLRPGADAPADELLSRRRLLQQDAAQLLGQADLRVKLQESSAALARMQLVALQRAQDALAVRASGYASERRPSGAGLQGLLPFLSDRR